MRPFLLLSEKMHKKLPIIGNFYITLQTISPLMNVIFADEALKELYETGSTKDSKYKKLARSRQFVEAYIQVVDLMLAIEKAADLAMYSYLHYEKLRHRPESSVRIQNRRVERLLFMEQEDGIEVRLINIDTNHYGNKR